MQNAKCTMEHEFPLPTPGPSHAGIYALIMDYQGRGECNRPPFQLFTFIPFGDDLSFPNSCSVLNFCLQMKNAKRKMHNGT